ncbi:hypothetical protein KFL_006930090 [Klebsormidium nitens]|uniref:Uncharacterized protein n=1 Tax=Klebsormidium nitens TaxID=105231 RepID=A0A1Y1INV9_KLENI|nr:hypothetical protein KFL_006930090 [Klebsormidium nitens]|eukprot:GAQ90861.1 hypothetical protein KFL_006930090 [Klebsormidium nitens]
MDFDQEPVTPQKVSKVAADSFRSVEFPADECSSDVVENPEVRGQVEGLVASWSELGLKEEDDKITGLERLMPIKSIDLTGPVDLKNYRQILTFDNLGRLRTPSLAYLSDLDRNILQQVGTSTGFGDLPVGCIRSFSGYGSTFAVSPYLKSIPIFNLQAQGDKYYQYHLSAAHNTSTSDEVLERGFWSDSILSGCALTRASGMRYRIAVHGEEDRTKYNLLNTEVRSPPSSPDKSGNPLQARYYKNPADGELFEKHVDVLLLVVEIDPSKARPNSQNRFFVPSGDPSTELDEHLPIFLSGTPGEVDLKDVPICLGHPVTVADRPVLAYAINKHMMKADIRGISFGHKVLTNGRQDKTSASSWRGMSGGVEGNMAHRGCFEGVHIQGNLDVKEFVYNRAVSKDEPYLVCLYVDYVLPSLAGWKQWPYPGQEASLRRWLEFHRELLQQQGLWAKVEAAGFA